MKTFFQNLSLLGLLIALTSSLHADDTIRFDAMPGSKMRIEGTSSIHDWQIESKLIGGFLEAGAGFPVEPGQAVKPGKVDAKVEVFVPVRSLKSLEKDGKPYSDSMDSVVREKMKEPTVPRVLYRLTELTLKESPKAPDTAYLFDSTGQLIVAGVTNTISMPITVTPLGDKKLKITGSTSVKMTQFGIQPPAPAIALGMIKTGDEVKLIFEWMVGQKTAPAK
jgi:hypothetical protein